MLRYVTAAACALGLLPTSAGGSGLPASTPLLVQSGQLIWAHSAEGMPFQDDKGTVFLPIQTTCDLLGARCRTDLRNRKVHIRLGDRQRTVPQLVVRSGPRGQVAYAPVRLLADPLGFQYAWNTATHRVNITRVLRQPGTLSAIQGVIAGQRDSPERSPTLTAPATATIHPLPHDPSTVQLTLDATTSGRTLRSYWKQATGGIGSSSPAACRQIGTTSTCQVNIPKDAVIVLASLTAG